MASAVIPGINKGTIREMKEFLQSIGSTHSFKTKDEYIERIKRFEDYLQFPWRKDQLIVLENFMKQKHKYHVVNGIFGCGKTTLLLGILINSIVKKLYNPQDVLFISFNVCIRDELKRKLRHYGVGSKVHVRTFDSIIYEICKIYNYEYLDLPNYDGKRKFCYKICREIEYEENEKKELSFSPKLIFIDETQDLEKQTFSIFQTFFPDCKIVFAGDIFQSIQKEPRESLLWFLLHNDFPSIQRSYMKETPRVPKKILETLQSSLQSYYPEFKDEITEWHSSNKISSKNIEWERFYSYNNIFEKMVEFIEKYDKKDVMILTFSSAITVKGAMGDIARIRHFLQRSGYDVNTNHKKLEEDKIFLSTANSSKGLERENVFVVLTFPLERAFINFSDDLVTNLITVAVTRTKKNITFCVPAYEDKFSRVLSFFENCPKPNKEKIREGKVLNEFGFSDYMNIEHCVTELLRQNIIRYDTRIKLKEHIKMYDVSKVFPKAPSPPVMKTEEERAFVGVLIENLITSTWMNEWPFVDDVTQFKNHPMYAHCYKKLEKIYSKYKSFVVKNKITIKTQFEGVYYYTQLHLAMHNKIFIELSPTSSERIKSYWATLKPHAFEIKPQERNIKIQSNMRMPWVTGIADAIVTNEKDEVNVWELKASVDNEWRDNALIQATLYALMTGKTWSRMTLLNPFRNEKCCFYFNSKNILSLRKLVYEDVIMFNTNCFLAKNYNTKNKSTFNSNNKVFVHLRKGTKGELVQYSVIQYLSPTKIHVLKNEFVIGEEAKICRESKITEKDAYEELNEFLEKLHMEVWINGKDKRIKLPTKNIYEMIGEENIFEKMKYQKNEDLKYSLDELNSLNINLTNICYLSTLCKVL